VHWTGRLRGCEEPRIQQPLLCAPAACKRECGGWREMRCRQQAARGRVFMEDSITVAGAGRANDAEGWNTRSS
jgi:hypothetical protein